MKLLLLFLIVTGISAHMPIFGDNLHIEDTQNKSWGVYIKVEKNYSLTLNVPAGKNISFSLSVPDSYKKKPNISVTLFGHGAADIECDPDFNGWNTEVEWNNGRRLDRRLDGELDSVRFEKDLLDIMNKLDLLKFLHNDGNALNLMLDSTKQLVVHQTTEKVFEPFGVQGYRPIVACQGNTEIGDDLFRLTITNNDEEALPLSIGVGMAESFGFVDLLFMSFTLMQSWLWAGKWWSLVVPIAAGVWYILVIFDIFEVTYEMTGVKPAHIGTLEKFGHLTGLFMLANALQFSIQIIYTYSMDVPMSNVWFPLIVHILLPILAYYGFSLFMNIDLHSTSGTIKHFGFGILFLVYTFGLLWQSYCLSLIGFLFFFVFKIRYKNDHILIPT